MVERCFKGRKTVEEFCLLSCSEMGVGQREMERCQEAGQASPPTLWPRIRKESLVVQVVVCWEILGQGGFASCFFAN